MTTGLPNKFWISGGAPLGKGVGSVIGAFGTSLTETGVPL